MLLVDEVERELVLVGADLVTDAAFPRAGQAVQRRVQEVHAAFEEQDAAVLTAEQSTLTDVVRQDIVEGGKPSDGLRVLNGLVLGRPHEAVGHRRQLSGRTLCRVHDPRQRDSQRRGKHRRPGCR